MNQLSILFISFSNVDENHDINICHTNSYTNQDIKFLDISLCFVSCMHYIYIYIYIHVYIYQGWGRLQRHDYDYDYDYTMITKNDYDCDYSQRKLITITIMITNP